MQVQSVLPEFARVNSRVLPGLIKQQPADFEVIEKLAFDPLGEGEHAFLFVRKTGLTTMELVQRIASLAGVARRFVSYAGLKDKHAITHQWFSVHLPAKQAPDWRLLENSHIQVLRSTRHNKKLRRGQIVANQFAVVIRELEWTGQALDSFLLRIKREGVPNYFTEQRFGIQGRNLDKALALDTSDESGVKRESRKYKTKRVSQQQGLYLSAARSLLFNLVVSARIERQNWNKAVDGDVWMKAGRHGMFSADVIDQDIEDRIAAGLISPTGPLFGVKPLLPGGAALQIEQAAMANNVRYQTLLLNRQVKADRRALRLMPKYLQVRELSNSSVKLEFELPRGSYATAVLRELIKYPGQMA